MTDDIGHYMEATARLREELQDAVAALRRYQHLRVEGRYEDDPLWTELDSLVAHVLNTRAQS